ncbi:hypothetical protein ABZ345_15510 [Lentzea sp. NPDC005914]|uniref:hypothetical protein n=1 Tax=Lentzea sp. NPDC005914 TaxID=3154572 RepID=UPI003406E39C
MAAFYVLAPHVGSLASGDPTAPDGDRPARVSLINTPSLIPTQTETPSLTVSSTPSSSAPSSSSKTTTTTTTTTTAVTITTQAPPPVTTTTTSKPRPTTTTTTTKPCGLIFC